MRLWDVAWRPWLVAGAALLLSVVAGQGADEKPVVSGLSHGVHGERVRIIVQVAPAPAFAAFTLVNPDRLVVDFPALEWSLPDGLDPGEVPYVSGLRYGLFRPDRARFVFDLSEPVAVERIFTQQGAGREPGRLVIDLSPTTRASFDARAGMPEAARWQDDALMAPAAAQGDIVVAIDPGHGGIDPGASHGKLAEKDVTLAFATQLAEILEARAGLQPFLVREQDEFVPLAERVARAHRAGAHVLISIHADAVAEGIANGMSVYKLSRRGTDAAAARLAERENRADLLAGADLAGESDALTRLLVELAQRGTQDESSKLAVAMLESLRGEVTLLRTRPLRQGNFRVLKAPDIPSVLLELGFLNSQSDRARLTDPEWRRTAAERIVQGVEDWTRTASEGFLARR